MKSHEKESIHPIGLSPNISSLEEETKGPLILICNEKRIRFLHAVAIQAGQNFNLTFEENRSVSSKLYLSVREMF